MNRLFDANQTKQCGFLFEITTDVIPLHFLCGVVVALPPFHHLGTECGLSARRLVFGQCIALFLTRSHVACFFQVNFLQPKAGMVEFGHSLSKVAQHRVHFIAEVYGLDNIRGWLGLSAVFVVLVVQLHDEMEGEAEAVPRWTVGRI